MVAEKNKWFFDLSNEQQIKCYKKYLFHTNNFLASLYKLSYFVLLQFKWQVSQLTETTAVPTVNITTVPLITVKCFPNICQRCRLLCAQRKSDVQGTA